MISYLKRIQSDRNIIDTLPQLMFHNLAYIQLDRRQRSKHIMPDKDSPLVSLAFQPVAVNQEVALLQGGLFVLLNQIFEVALQPVSRRPLSTLQLSDPLLKPLIFLLHQLVVLPPSLILSRIHVLQVQFIVFRLPIFTFRPAPIVLHFRHHFHLVVSWGVVHDDRWLLLCNAIIQLLVLDDLMSLRHGRSVHYHFGRTNHHPRIPKAHIPRVVVRGVGQHWNVGRLGCRKCMEVGWQ